MLACHSRCFANNSYTAKGSDRKVTPRATLAYRVSPLASPRLETRRQTALLLDRGDARSASVLFRLLNFCGR